MEFIKTDIEGVVLIRPVKHGDARGYFMETFKPNSTRPSPA